jgi:methyl-accepting chemotaxis protein
MLRFFSNIPIFRRIFIAFTLVFVVPGIVLIALAGFFLDSLTTQNQAVSTSVDAQSQAAQQGDNLQNMNALLQARFSNVFASLSGKITDPSLPNSGALNGADLAAQDVGFDQFLQTYPDSFGLATSPQMASVRAILLSNDAATGSALIKDQQQSLELINAQLWPTYHSLQQQETAMLDALDPTLHPRAVLMDDQGLNQHYQRAYLVLWKADINFINLRNTWQRVIDDAETTSKTVTTVGNSQTQPVLIATAVAFLFTFFVVILSGYIINQTITRPLSQLAFLTRRISRGDTRARASVMGRDEIATVARSMNSMLDNILRLIQNAQEQRDVLQGHVEKLVNEVSGVGEGDLRVQAEVTQDSLGVLADSFNYMVEELGGLVIRVKIVAGEIASSTNKTYERMTQVVEDAEVQIQQIARALVGVEYMTEVSQQVAQRANVLYISAREARMTAETGREAVTQTLDGMGRIHENVQETASRVQVLGERSQEINNIVEVMSTIAHQTNRLALDAAIQSAMAGENGKGFGAVAADIRRLAELAKEQVTMIGRIVRSLRDDIGAVAVSMNDTQLETTAGTKLAHEVGTALGSIFSVVEQQAQEIETINSMVVQHQSSSTAVAQIMAAVSQVTQRSSTSTHEAGQKMEQLAHLAERLQSSVEAFKLRDDPNYYHSATSDMTVTSTGNVDSPLTVSSIFRTVAASSQQSHAGQSASNQMPFGVVARDNTPWNLPPLPPGDGNGNGGNSNVYTPVQSLPRHTSNSFSRDDGAFSPANPSPWRDE